MAQDIGAAGLDEALVTAARAAGYDTLTALQEAALPVLLRGGNAVLHASTGAGVTGAFALPLLGRLAEADDREGGPSALVLTPTPERAEAVAGAMAILAGESGVTVRAAGPGWRSPGADVLVMASDRAMNAVQASALKLEAVQAVVFTELSEQQALGLGEALDTLVTLVPRDAQRVITSGELTSEVERFVESHVRRALTMPARPADPAAEQAAEPIAQIAYIVVAESQKPELAARLLQGGEGDVLLFTRTSARAERMQAELERRGILDDDGVSIRVAAFNADVAGGDRVLSYDVPFSVDQLRRLHAGGGTIMVTPAELAHFRRMAREAPFTVKQRRARELDGSGLDAFRESVRAALGEEDLAAQLLVLDPLFEEHSPAEVAAALSALLRRRAPVRPAAGAGTAAGAADTGSVPKSAMSPGFARLFVSIGTRDNVRPADIVGAITGEAGIKGDQVGRVDIRDTFSVVEVAASAAEKVIRALNGTTMRGRSLRVDFDRKKGGPDAGPRGGGPRRTSRPGGPGGAHGPGGPGGAGGRPRRRPPE
ncbi:MAG TPA: DEAD/DEAH box helicase [Longimicrobiales bacterium]|nr:DEAD/DEAH box helicase [Longimicrobiales bacterium]